MMQIALPVPKSKIDKKIIIGAVIAVLLLVVVAGYIWLQRTGKIPEFNLGMLLGKLTTGFRGEESIIVSEKEPAAEELKITIPSAASSAEIYEQTAQKGEGITHLARKALKEYVKGKGENPNLSPEHKIYIEDYLQKKTGDKWLKLGEKVSFSGDLIKEAINKSQQLTSSQLENLTQYSAQVASL